MMELSAKIINELMHYLSNDEIQICLDTSPIFDVLTFNDKFDIKLNNTVMYLQCFSLYSGEGDGGKQYFYISSSVHKTLKSAAFKLFKTVIREFDIANLKIMSLCSNVIAQKEYDNPDYNYIYKCYRNIIHLDYNEYAPILFNYMEIGNMKRVDILKAIKYIIAYPHLHLGDDCIIKLERVTLE